MRFFNIILDSTFSYVESYMGFIAGQIMTSEKHEPEDIAKILTDAKRWIDKTKKDFIASALFDFVTPEGLVIASNIDGVIENPKTVKKEQRRWMTLAPETPWKGHASSPDIGITTPDPVIPFGFGVTDKSGKFLGTISTGISIPFLKEQLSNAIGKKHYRFVMFTSNGDFLMCSDSDHIPTEIYNNDFAEALSYINTQNDASGTLNQTLHMNGTEYLFFNKSQEYPFVTLIGMERKDVVNSKDLQNKILQLNKEQKYDEMFALSLFYLFQTKMIKPISGLKEYISSSESFGIPKSFSVEINDLFTELEQIESFMTLKLQKDVAEEISEETQKELEEKESLMNKKIDSCNKAIEKLKHIEKLLKSYIENSSLIDSNKDFLSDIYSQIEEILTLANEI